MDLLRTQETKQSDRSVQLLTPSTVQALCQELGIRPTKQLGQNFVMDPSTVRKIVQAAKLPGRAANTNANATGEKPHVLEVGPGLGSLTLGLLEAGVRVSAVEIDQKLAFYLPQTLKHHTGEEFIAENFHLVVGDALKLTANDIAKSGFGQPKYLVSNLPYNVAVPVIFNCLAQFPSIETVLVMVQKEVALRLSATKDSKLYGVPSVKMAWYGQCHLAGDISRKIFYPEPNVDSALVRLHRTNPFPNSDRTAIFHLIEQAFSVRRKMLRGALKKWAVPFNVTKLLDAAGIDPTQRAENLEVTDYVRLAQVKENLLSTCPNLTAEDPARPLRSASSLPAPEFRLSFDPLPSNESTDTVLNNQKARVKTAKAYVPAKINLFLAVGPNGENGYHQLRSFFQGLDFGETVTVNATWPQSGLTGQLEIELETELVGPPQATGYQSGRDQAALDAISVQENLAYRAAEAVAKKVGFNGKLQLKVEKQAPIAGGMAGGSADAAAALLATNQALDAGLLHHELHSIARTLGADVPFGLAGGTSFANGAGNQITPLPPLRPRRWILAVNKNLLSTPKVFRAFDALTATGGQNNATGENPATGENSLTDQSLPFAQAASAKTPQPWAHNLGDYYQIWQDYLQSGIQTTGDDRFIRGLHNDLAVAAQLEEPSLPRIQNAALAAGALAVQICGSGPTVAALVENDEQAQAVQDAWQADPSVLFTVESFGEGDNTESKLWKSDGVPVDSTGEESWTQVPLPNGLDWQSYWKEN